MISKEQQQRALDRHRAYEEKIKAAQEVERLNVTPIEVKIKIPGTDAFQIFYLGDLHVASVFADIEKIKEIRDEILKTPNTYVVFLGDEIDGFKSEYASTSSSKVSLDAQQQQEYFRDAFLIPLAKKGKVLAMVSDYFGHPQWPQEASTLNPCLTMAYEAGIELVRNSGDVVITRDDGSEYRINCFHDAKSSSKVNPVDGVRKHVNEYSVKDPKRPDVASMAHSHWLQVTKEIRSRNGKASVLTICGSAKGNTPELPDLFATKAMAGRLYDPPGANTIHYKGESYPSISFREGKKVQKALSVLDKTEKDGLTKEIFDRIYTEIQARPKISFDKKLSVAVSNSYQEGATPEESALQNTHYENVVYKIDTKLPITFHTIAHTRIGSNSFREFEKDLIEQEITPIEKDPFATLTLLRRLVDPDAPRSEDRQEILERITRLFKPIGEQGKILSILLDETLRNDHWKKTKGDSVPIMSGTYLSKELNAPLINNQAIMEFIVNKSHYSIFITDKLGNSGSRFNPFLGIRRIYDWEEEDKHDITIGGHMERSGFTSFYDRHNLYTEHPVLVPTGWWSKVDSHKKGNEKYGGRGGQALIFMPDKKIVYPTSDTAETELLQKALTLWVGLRKLGITQKVMGKAKNPKSFS